MARDYSKSRLFEVFQKVNKIKLNENVGDENILSAAFNKLQSGALDKEAGGNVNVNTIRDENQSKVSLVGNDKENNQYIFEFQVEFNNGDQEGVYEITSVILQHFTFKSNDESIVLDLDENSLVNFNEQFSKELMEVIDKYFNIEETTPAIEENKEIEILDQSDPFNGASERTQDKKMTELPFEKNLKVNDKSLNENQNFGNLPQEKKAIIHQAINNLKTKKGIGQYSPNPNEVNFEVQKILAKRGNIKETHPLEDVMDYKIEGDEDYNIPNDKNAKKAAVTDISKDKDFNKGGSQPHNDYKSSSEKWRKYPLPFDTEFDLDENDFQPNDTLNAGAENYKKELNSNDLEKAIERREEEGDQIHGGLGDNSDPDDYDSKQLLKGIEVEMEHTDDPMIALEIVLDHLSENPIYYGDNQEIPDDMAQKQAAGDAEEIEKKSEDEEISDELLGFKPHNVGDYSNVDENDILTEVDVVNRDVNDNQVDKLMSNWRNLNSDQRKKAFDLLKTSLVNEDEINPKMRRFQILLKNYDKLSPIEDNELMDLYNTLGFREKLAQKAKSMPEPRPDYQVPEKDYGYGLNK